MKHLGDITKIHGNEIDAVDCITGGSPCQDLSIAGKREGLAGNRSGLFTEMIRIIKEMRERDIKDGRTDYDIRPRFVIWENVPGAFSSNKGADFGCVLEEFARIKEPSVTIPRPTDRKGRIKWKPAGCIVGNSWSIAWRTLNAQFWGVPQRRKRIALVADFAGQCAAEILFERKGMSGDITESGKARESVATDAGAGIEKTSRAISFQERAGKPGGGKGILIQNERTGALSTLNNQSVCVFEPGAASRLGGYCWEDKAGTLRANAGDNQQAVVYGIGSYDSNAMKSDNPHSGIYEADTSRTLDLNGGSPACNQGGMAVVQKSAGFCPEESAKTRGIGYEEENAPSLRSGVVPGVVCLNDQGGNRMDVTEDVTNTLRAESHHPPLVPVLFENHSQDARYTGPLDKSPSLTARYGTGGNNQPLVVKDSTYDVRFTSEGTRNARQNCYETDTARTLDTGGNAPNSNQGGVAVVKEVTEESEYIVRRLTPLECERLQGLPDNWTDIGEWTDTKGKLHKPSDSARYKALGNSIALPQWQWIIDRMAYYLPQGATLGSLFDGIGGFPLCWQRTHGNGTAVWASEVEKFCIAVTNKRFNGK